jgi:hypothetical protein
MILDMGATRKPRTALQQKRHDESVAKKEGVLARLADGIANLVTSDQWAEWLKVQSRFHTYSFGNVMLILCQKPDATQVASFGKWKSMGRFPYPGTGLYIWAPHDKWETKTDPATGEETRVKVTGFHLATVHDVSDTHGEPLPEEPDGVVTKLQGEDPDGLFGHLVAMGDAIGYPVALVDDEVLGEANGRCHYSADGKTGRIEVKRSLSPLMRVKTGSHELTHAQLHGPDGAMISRPQRELEAESGAYVVLDHFGQDSAPYTFGYVASWASGDPDEIRDAIKASGARIHSAAKAIIEFVTKAQAEAAKTGQALAA